MPKSRERQICIPALVHGRGTFPSMAFGTQSPAPGEAGLRGRRGSTLPPPPSLRVASVPRKPRAGGRAAAPFGKLRLARRPVPSSGSGNGWPPSPKGRGDRPHHAARGPAGSPSSFSPVSGKRSPSLFEGCGRTEIKINGLKLASTRCQACGQKGSWEPCSLWEMGWAKGWQMEQARKNISQVRSKGFEGVRTDF